MNHQQLETAAKIFNHIYNEYSPLTLNTITITAIRVLDSSNSEIDLDSYENYNPSTLTPQITASDEDDLESNTAVWHTLTSEELAAIATQL